MTGSDLMGERLPGKASAERSSGAMEPATAAGKAVWDDWVLRRPSQVGLHRRISLFVAVGLLVCLATFGILGIQAVNQTTQRELQDRLLLTRMAADQIDRALLGSIHSLEVMAATANLYPTGSLPVANQRSLVALRVQTDPRAHRLSLLGSDGTIISTDPDNQSLLGQSLMPDRSIAKVYLNGTWSISGLRTTSGGRHVVTLSVPIRDPAGGVAGVLSGDFDLSGAGLLAFLQPMNLGSTGEVQIVDDQGNVLESGGPTGAEHLADYYRLAQLVQRGEPYVGICHDCHAGNTALERRQDVVAFAPLENAPWGVLLRQSSEEAFAAANDLRGKMIAFGLFLLIGGLLLAQITTRSVVKPIESLTRAAQRIAKGDLSSPVPPVGHSEIAVLADSFDEMRERLRRSLAEIEHWNETLEHRVDQRTRELTALLQAANTLTSTLDLDTLLAYILTRAAETFKVANAGALMLYDRAHDQLAVRSSVGYHAASLRRLHVRPEEGIFGKVFASGRELLCASPSEIGEAMANLGEPNRRLLALSSSGLAPAASGICAPLVTKGQPIGCLFLVSPRSDAFSPSEARLLRAMADQAAVAVENAQLYEEVRRSEERRGALLAKLIGAQEDERRRIARELHDETSQALTALVLSLAQLRKVTPPAFEQVHAGINEIESLADLTLDEIHRLVYDLRPTLLDDLGLVPAIQWYLETNAQKAGISLSLELEGMEPRLPPEVETVLFRIVQEGVTNILRHSEASSATVHLRRRSSGVIVIVEDDGKGFDTRALLRKGVGHGFGVLGMKERINLLGGKFTIISRPGRGTRLVMDVPVATGDRKHDPSIVG